MGGGGFSMEPENPRLDSSCSRWRVRRGRASASSRRPAATPRATSRSFYRAFAAFDCRPSDLTLFARNVDDLRAFVLAQDVIYVGGGNTANMLAVWRAHGLDAILRNAWAEGIVLCGISAGMNCWFEESVTDSFGRGSRRCTDGLGL